MSENFSSDLNNSFTPPDVSSISFYMYCITTRPTCIVFTTLKVIRTIITLPLCISILHHGLQQWKLKRLSSSASPMSHSDCFTYHMVSMELIVDLAGVLRLAGIFSGNYNVLYAGILTRFFIWYGEMCFHALTCVERYLAVVHPITYMKLRNERAIRCRNVTIGCVWLLSFIGMCLVTVDGCEIVFTFSLLCLSIMTATFCSLSVLHVLIRPGPAKQSENRKWLDPSKQRAFLTLVVILAVLVLRFLWDVVWLKHLEESKSSDCMLMVFGVWISLPCSLVLPLLFLHKAGKLELRKTLCFI